MVVKGNGPHLVGPKTSGRCPGGHMSQSVPGEDDREELVWHTGTCRGPEVGSGVWGLEGS